MKIKVNTIITLENLEQFMVLNDTVYLSKHYFLVMGLDENKEPISSKVAIFQEEVDNEDSYVIKIEDNELIITLTKLLKSQLD